MRRRIVILVLLPLQLIAQNPHFPKVKISEPCTDNFINNYKGKWLIHDPSLSQISVNDYHDEVTKQLNQIHSLVYQTYPQPLGSDAVWAGSFVKSSFAGEVKYELVREDEWEQHTVKTNPVYSCTYSLTLCSWFCHGANEIMNGYPEGGGAGLVIHSNNLLVLNGDFLPAAEWTIDGRPIKQKMPVTGKWKGYDVMSVAGGVYADLNSSYFVLLNRDGILPYIPVTRKQYLDRAIIYVNKFYDHLIAVHEQITDQATGDEDKNSDISQKNAAFKKLNNELEKTTKDGLLNAPAIVRPDALLFSDGPLFLSEAEGGIALATENPDYFRTDLRKYVPQFFVLELSWSTAGWSKNFRKTVEESFPVETLQAMIDK